MKIYLKSVRHFFFLITFSHFSSLVIFLPSWVGNSKSFGARFKKLVKQITRSYFMQNALAEASIETYLGLFFYTWQNIASVRQKKSEYAYSII